MLWWFCVSCQVLLEAGIKTADAVVLGSGSSAGGDLESDARVLAAILQVEGGGQLLALLLTGPANPLQSTQL
jgi:hypothetical protein